MAHPPVFLSDADLRALGVSTADVIDAIETAIRAEAAGALLTAPKSALIPSDGRYVMTTLSTKETNAADAPPVTIVKCVTVAPDNPSKGLAGIEGAIMALDGATGVLEAVMDASWVTAARTAGLSAVVAKRLADPASAKIGFIGCGVQARGHLDAFVDLFPIAEIRAFGRGAGNRDRLLSYAAEKGLVAHVAATPEEALRDMDIVVTSITLDYSIEPFLDAAWLKPGAFAAITDLGIPWRPTSLPAFNAVYVDDLAQEEASEKKMAPPQIVRGDLKGLVAGAAPAAFDPARRTAFIFRGLALGDFAVAALALERAR